MSYSLFLMGVLPLIIFVLVDSFAGVKKAVVFAALFAFAEALFTYFYFGFLDEISLGALVLVLIFAYLSYKSNNPIFFKLQPVFLGVLTSVFFLIMQFLNKPIMVLVSQKYKDFFPPEIAVRVMDPIMVQHLSILSLYLGWGFLLHSFCVYYAAKKMSNLWWLLIRGLGVYIMMFVCALLARF